LEAQSLKREGRTFKQRARSTRQRAEGSIFAGLPLEACSLPRGTLALAAAARLV
jgi:hypothetical protein